MTLISVKHIVQPLNKCPVFPFYAFSYNWYTFMRDQSHSTKAKPYQTVRSLYIDICTVEHILYQCSNKYMKTSIWRYPNNNLSFSYLQNTKIEPNGMYGISFMNNFKWLLLHCDINLMMKIPRFHLK